MYETLHKRPHNEADRTLLSLQKMLVRKLCFILVYWWRNHKSSI